MTQEAISPNALTGTATEHTAVNSLETLIFEKATAMTNASRAQRNLPQLADGTATGESTEAIVETPVAPENIDQEAEVADTTAEDTSSTEEIGSPEEVSEDGTEADTTPNELIDFLEFTNSNPNAKFKFMRNGKEVVIDAKKAASILGQGSAIHEEARELKVQKAEFDEYLKSQKDYHESLSLAMEFTIQPKLKEAYDGIIQVQGYQSQFRSQLDTTTDYAERARIESAMTQNEAYLQQQSRLIADLKPKVDEFKDIRKKQVSEYIENNRKSFKDKELKNSYVFNEIRDKIAKDWAGAKNQLVPGIDNIDLISSDEHVLALIRDGLKYRDRPKGTSAGQSIAALTKPKTTLGNAAPKKDEISQLREQANKGDRKAAANLLEARIAQIRSTRR